jgi:anti-anti-sigma factor
VKIITGGFMDNPILLSKKLKDCVILYTNHYLNALGAEKLEDECEALLKMGYENIVINFENTELINSIGISVLIGLIEKMRNFEGNLSFTNLDKTQLETFKMLGLNKYVPIYEKEVEALERISK